jgi:hypothetical protein
MMLFFKIKKRNGSPLVYSFSNIQLSTLLEYALTVFKAIYAARDTVHIFNGYGISMLSIQYVYLDVLGSLNAVF